MSSTSGSGGEQRIFLRKASGLIRSASPFDTFIYNTGLVSIGLGVGTIMYYGPAFYPGGDLLLGSLLAGFMMILICLGMITWSVTLPRSGGIYVFGSRGLPPFLALTLSLVEITSWLFYCAIAAYWIVLLGISPTLAMLGYLSGNANLIEMSATVTEPMPLFIIGTAILTISALILVSGMRRYLMVQKVVFTIAVLGSIALIIILATGSNEEFIATFNQMMAPADMMGIEDAYGAVIASASANGWSTANADWWTTLQVSNWCFLPLIGAAFSIAIAGEIKSVEKSQTYGMLGAVIGTVIIWLITISLATSVFGYDFMGSAIYNFFIDPDAAAAPVVAPPTDASITLLSGILTQSSLVTIIVSVGLIAWMWMWIPGMHTFGIRAIVAWSFDRVAPAPLGHISPTRHTPTVAIAFVWLVTVIFMALFCFTDDFAAIIILIEAAVFAWSIILIAGIFFPYVRPQIYEKSPIARKKILGLPMMTVACFFGALAAQFYFWNLWMDPFAAGHEWDQLKWVVGLFVIGILFYFFMKFYRRSQGVDVTLAFKEIPIE
jgi:APA family basic amino acid/polyamine antiporter